MKKKVLHIVESFGSGVFSFLVDLINGTDKDFDIIVAYGVRKETLDNFEEYFSERVKFIKVENFTRSIKPQKDIKALFEIKEIINKENPDIIHLHSSKAGFLGRFASVKRKYKMLYNPHGFSFLKKDDSKLKRTIYWFMEKIAAIFNSKCIIVGCSKGEYEEAKKLNKKSVHINNGINIELLSKEIYGFEEKKIDYDNLKICTVGRIGYQKNPEMFNEIANLFPQIQFTWIGDGDLKDKLTSSNINCTGWKSRKQVLQMLNNQDIFILTSLWEGLPISLLEAMYMKKICIVSDCIGNRDVIINEKNGFIARNLKQYKEYIEKIIIEKEKNLLGEKAYNDVIQEYNTSKMISNYKNIYY